MTAHMDSVSGLAIDPHGLYLVSGGEGVVHWMKEGEGGVAYSCHLICWAYVGSTRGDPIIDPFSVSKFGQFQQISEITSFFLPVLTKV